MNAKHLIWSLTAASLIATSSASIAGPGEQHERHSVSGPLPRAAREAIERFRDVDAAIAAGYVEFQGCVSGPEQGAMVVHYVNTALFDGQLDVDEPEALVYEPRNNRLQQR